MSAFGTLLFRYSFGLLCHSLILYLMTDCKYSRRRTLAVWLGVCLFATLTILPLIRSIRATDFLFVAEAVFSLSVYCAAYLLLCRGLVWRNLFVFFAYATFFLFSLALSSSVSQMFFGGSHWATVAGRTLFMALYALWLLTAPAGNLRRYANLEKGWFPLAAFSTFSGLTIYIMVLTFMILRVDPGIRLAVWSVLLLLVGSAYLVASRTIVLMSRAHEARETEAQRKLLENQLAAEREFVSQARTHRHDLRHHISLLDDYLERGDLAGARAYLSQYQAGLDADTLEMYCENATANAFLRLTARRCTREHISFTCRAVIPGEMPLSSPELAAVLGNVLENAWEASRQCRSPWITVTARRRGRALLVEVKNAAAGESRFEDDLPVSTKPGGGLGLRSVSRVLAKHGGLLRCFRSGEVFYTQMAIPLCPVRSEAAS